MRDRDAGLVVTALAAGTTSVDSQVSEPHGLLADLVDHAAMEVNGCSLTEVTDAVVLDREDAGAWLSGLLDRRIAHRCGPSEHLFVAADTEQAVRIVVARSEVGEPVTFVAQTPRVGSEPDLYRQLVDAARTASPPRVNGPSPVAVPNPATHSTGDDHG
ncbi:hypothetical protein ACXIZN_41510 [Amycolatopsis sp. TRM77291]